MTLSHLKYLLTDSRFSWFARALPSLERAEAMFLARDYTMTPFERCQALWETARTALRKNVPGAFVECGVWRGGSAGIMGRALKAFDPGRPLHLFDSFEGLPEPGPEDGAKAVDYSGGKATGRLATISKCDAGIEIVRRFLFERLQLDPQCVHFHPGWFQDTIPVLAKEIGPISVLRLDGDWYASTKVCLEHLYPQLSPGGVLVLDDYNCWEGCRMATDEYRQSKSISAPLVAVDNECCYWIKPDHV